MVIVIIIFILRSDEAYYERKIFLFEKQHLAQGYVKLQKTVQKTNL